VPAKGENIMPAPVNPWAALAKKPPKKPKRGGRKPAGSSGNNAWTQYVGQGK
jgi:hypothetical protein